MSMIQLCSLPGPNYGTVWVLSYRTGIGFRIQFQGQYAFSISILWSMWVWDTFLNREQFLSVCEISNATGMRTEMDPVLVWVQEQFQAWYGFHINSRPDVSLRPVPQSV